MTSKQFFEMFLQTRQAMQSAKSALGGQLSALKDGLGGTDEYQRAHSAEIRYAKYAAMILIWDKLNKEQQNLVIMYYTPVGSKEYTKKVRQCDLKELKVPIHDMGGECNAITRAGTTCKNRRPPGEPRCQKHINTAESPPMTWVTYQGEELVCYDEEGNPVVRGSKPVYLTYAEIAVKIDSSPEKVGQIIRRAHKIVEENAILEGFCPV